MIRRSVLFFTLMLAAASTVPAFQASAYLPHYRLDPLSGAENLLGRPSMDPAPRAWDGRIKSDDFTRGLPQHWSESSWSLNLQSRYDAFFLHLPLDDAFLKGDTPDSRHLSYIRNLKAESGSEIRISLLGHSDVFMALASEEKPRKDFIRLLSNLYRENNLDGIDLDWEFSSSPRKEEEDILMLLSRELKEALPGKAVISAALSRWRLPDADFFELIDEVNLMAYDGYGRHSTYESALADAEILLARSGMDASDIHLGIPFYGRIFDSESEDYFIGTRNYRDIVRDFAPEPDVDEAGGYFFNGVETVRRKTEWAEEAGFGGVFVWEPFYDSTGSLSLSRSIRNSIDGK